MLFAAEAAGGQAKVLRAEPALVAGFVEEMLRFDGSSQTLPRVTTCGVNLAGVEIPAASLVVALVGSAGRDERKSKSADRFDMSRGSAGLNFGHGIIFAWGPRWRAWRRRSG